MKAKVLMVSLLQVGFIMVHADGYLEEARRHWWCSPMWSGSGSFVIHHHHKCTDQVLYGTAAASSPGLGSEISVYGKNCMW